MTGWSACGSIMGELHALYRSQFRPFRDRPDVLVWGRWRWCPERAKPVPFPHAFTPWRLFPEFKQYDTGEVGEVPGDYPVLPDEPIERYLGQNVCGSADVWRFGALFADRLTPAEDWDGIPLCCIAGPPPPGGVLIGGEADQGLTNAADWDSEESWSAVAQWLSHYAAAWRSEEKWAATSTSSARYAAAWSSEESWDAVAQSLGRYSAAWRSEEKWAAVHRTTAHYSTAWRSEEKWAAVDQSLGHYAAAWRSEEKWAATSTTSARYAAAWSSEESWDAVALSPAHYAAAWRSEEKWAAVDRSTAHYATAWQTEEKWAAVAETLGRYSATWHSEESWNAVAKTLGHYAAAWHSEESWNAVAVGRDNIITFTCASLVATGSTQGTAAAIVADTNNVTSTGANQGVILPNACNRIIVWNANPGGGNSIKVYPPSGGTIGTFLANAPATITPLAGSEFVEITAGVYRQVGVT